MIVLELAKNFPANMTNTLASRQPCVKALANAWDLAWWCSIARLGLHRVVESAACDWVWISLFNGLGTAEIGAHLLAAWSNFKLVIVVEHDDLLLKMQMNFWKKEKPSVPLIQYKDVKTGGFVAYYDAANLLPHSCGSLPEGAFWRDNVELRNTLRSHFQLSTEHFFLVGAPPCEGPNTLIAH